MELTKDWKQKYETVKDLLVSPVNYEKLFEAKSIDGKNLYILNMGAVNFPTGNILVRDPLVYLTKDEEPYFQKVPTGVFKLETLVAEIEKGDYRYIATRIKFNQNKVLIYREALKGDEILDNLDEDSFFGFNVDAGLATVVDVTTRDEYCKFYNEWHSAHPEKNIYDDLFLDEFKKSYKANPDFQRPDGDWINYKLEGTDLTVPMIQTGFGDGVYPVYFGYDESNTVCELVIEYIFTGADFK